MPAIDRCHEPIVHALEKADWRVRPVPHLIRIPKRRNPLLADIKAVRGENEIIIVEAKCFVLNTPDELYSAIGQYLVYRSLMSKAKVAYPLYLAVPLTAYHGILEEMGMDVMAETGIKLIVVDMENEVVVRWLE